MRVTQSKTELTRKSVKHLSHAVFSRSNMIDPLDPNVIERAKEKGERVREKRGGGSDKDGQRQRQTDGDGERERRRHRERERERDGERKRGREIPSACGES